MSLELHQFSITKYGIQMKGLIYQEIFRVFRIFNQTIISPIVSSFMFAGMILLAMATEQSDEHIRFIMNGIIISSIIQNTFMNSSHSFIMSKVLGYIIDLLIPPLTNLQIMMGYIVPSVIRSLIIGFGVFLITHLFIVDMMPNHLSYLVIIAILSSILMSLFGIFASLLTDNFESNSMVGSYLVTPLSMLSGTFYSIKKLPLFLQEVNKFNPFFYMIDGFRKAAMYSSDATIPIILLAFNFIMFTVVYCMLGTHLRK